MKDFFKWLLGVVLALLLLIYCAVMINYSQRYERVWHKPHDQGEKNTNLP